MEKIKVHRSTSYTVLDNEIAFDKAVGLTALGLHRYIMTMHTAGRNITIQDLISYRNADARTARDGRRSVTTAINQLIEAGYVRREQISESGKYVTWQYHISEFPMWKNDGNFMPVEVDGEDQSPNVHFPNAQNVHSEITQEKRAKTDESPNVQNVHCILSNNILSNARAYEEDLTDTPQREEKGKADFVPPAAPPAELPDIETVISDVQKWVENNSEWLRLQADRYDAAKYGPVANQVIRFCCYYGTPSDDSRFTGQFYRDPINFFRRRFPMWLLDESYFKRKIDMPAPSSAPRQATYRPQNQQQAAPEKYQRPSNALVEDLMAGIVKQKLNQE